MNQNCSVEYTATDGNGLQSTSRISWEVSQTVAPTAADDGIFGIIPEAPFVTNPLVNDIDGDSPIDPTSVTILTQDPNGTATVDPVTGEITMVANVGYEGPLSIEYEVCDTDGNCANAEIEYEVCVPTVFEIEAPFVAVGGADLNDLQPGDQFICQSPAPFLYDVLHTVNFVGSQTTLRASALITLTRNAAGSSMSANIATQIIEKATGNPVDVPHCQIWKDLDSGVPNPNQDGAAFDPTEGTLLHLGNNLVTVSGPGPDSSDDVPASFTQLLAPPAGGAGSGDWTNNIGVQPEDLSFAARVQFQTGTANVWFFNEGVGPAGNQRGFVTTFFLADCVGECPNFPEIPTV